MKWLLSALLNIEKIVKPSASVNMRNSFNEQIPIFHLSFFISHFPFLILD
jgi:hypothetical protein